MADLASRGQMLAEARQRLDRLRALREDWDSYGALPVAEESIRTTVAVLDRLVLDDGPTPQLCPMTDGGVEVEWLVSPQYLSIESDHRGRLSFFAEDEASGVTLLEADGLPLDEAAPILEQAARLLAEMAPRVRFRPPGVRV